MYSSTDTVDGCQRRRQVESEWDRLQASAKAFCSTRPELRDINVGLMFSGPVPPRRQHADFIAAHRHELRSDDVEYWPPTISTPLMGEYLPSALPSRRSACRMAFQPDCRLRGDAGHFLYQSRILSPASPPRIFGQRTNCGLPFNAAREYRKHFLPIGDDFDMFPALDGFRFSTGFVMTCLRSYQWKAGREQEQIDR